ncbi:MAG: biotin--[acetyl-CoA-carboxylase] ligase [Ignavibacteria bacterium GWB2_35_12]|nr:MAG: biotin--[acetyl-CoA-carboxylase] ligase [Ignavibacteria bacterium GWB2_35_12]OGU91532.1 MAG: biotin--[acetyl-CoA-carboxylase] ligase [Ignavibacteria bacterium RIFOXYA2_FULL_35_10]OGV24814.1 MAG: biotin--[acetyl-CoA-carboxylase] ligase [Ignavibacteria bacterium RIFOXYC2_FULL_35_21]
MIVVTDNIRFAEQYIEEQITWKRVELNELNDNIRLLVSRMFNTRFFYVTEIERRSTWRYLFAVEYIPESQYDILINTVHDYNDLPGRILCLAGSGDKFHGYKNREWISKLGNIHLSIYLSPHLEVQHFGVGFLILSAVSVLQAIDSIKGLKEKAYIKWVNDILIDGAKVSGVLAHAQVQGNAVTDAVLGIGLNVEAVPYVEPTPFVPMVTTLANHIDNKNDCSMKIVFNFLLKYLEKNYSILLSEKYSELLKIYKDRSNIIGKNVKIWSDVYAGTPSLIAEGKLLDIGNDLELIIEGHKTPVITGRLELI